MIAEVYPFAVPPAPEGECVAAGCQRRATLLEVAQQVEPGPRKAVLGSDLCEVHVRRFQQSLDELSRRAIDLEKAVIRATSGPSRDGGGKPSGVRDVGEYWNPSATHVLYDLRDWTRYLVRTIRKDRARAAIHHTPVPYAPPFPRIPAGEDLDDSRSLNAAMQLRLLSRRYGRWLALYPGLGPDWLVEARTFVRRSMGAVSGTGVRRVGLEGHYCHVAIDVADDGVTPILCYGQLVGVLVEPGQDASESKVLCTINPAHSMPVRDAVRRDPDPNAYAWVEISVAADALQVGERRAMQLAVEDQWRVSVPLETPIRAGRPARQYLWRDVVSTYYRRKEDA